MLIGYAAFTIQNIIYDGIFTTATAKFTKRTISPFATAGIIPSFSPNNLYNS
jgi:hypothetical protein